MNSIHVHSRRAIEAHAFSAPAVAICVAYPDGRAHRVAACGPLLGVLHLRFHDVTGDGTPCFPKEGKSKGVPMTPAQALEIVAFVDRWRGEAEELHVACFGGVSRSRGIACAVAQEFGRMDAMVEIARLGDPNSFVWALVAAEFARRRSG